MWKNHRFKSLRRNSEQGTEFRGRFGLYHIRELLPMRSEINLINALVRRIKTVFLESPVE